MEDASSFAVAYTDCDASVATVVVAMAVVDAE